MARSPSNAVSFAKTFATKNQNFDQSAIQYEVADEACSRLWMAAPWAWTVAQTSAPVTVSASATDYSFTPPTDLAYYYRARLWDGANVDKDLKIENSLPAAADYTKVGETISIAATSGGIRVYPHPVSCSPAQKIHLYYKKTPPVIDSTNFTSGDVSSHLTPARWWHVYKSLILAQAYKFSDDARGFDIQIDPITKQVKMSGELALAEYLLNEMRAKEPLPFEWETRVEAKADRK